MRKRSEVGKGVRAPIDEVESCTLHAIPGLHVECTNKEEEFPVSKKIERVVGDAAEPHKAVEVAADEMAKAIKDEIDQVVGVEVSRLLSEELKKPPPLFVSANGPGGGLTPDFAAVVERVYAEDMLRDYERVTHHLTVGETRGDYASILKALDEAETNARVAHQAYLGARLEAEKWELDSAEVTGAIRQQATEVLEEEKARGDRKKAITNADVESKIAELHPDEWRHQRLQREKIKGTVEHLQRLADLWLQKCRSLGTILATLRK